MSIRDFSNAWDEATQHAQETKQEAELTPEQLSTATGLRVRSGVAAGFWGYTEPQGCTEPRGCD